MLWLSTHPLLHLLHVSSLHLSQFNSDSRLLCFFPQPRK